MGSTPISVKMWKTICLSLLLFTKLAFSESSLPKDLQDPVLFCEGCYGTMYEIDNMMIDLKHLKLTERVKQTMDSVCSNDILRKYVFSPPKMTKVCKAMVHHFKVELDRYLRDSYKQGRVINDPYELVKDFCIDGGTEACANVKIPSVQRKLEEIKKLKE